MKFKSIFPLIVNNDNWIEILLIFINRFWSKIFQFLCNPNIKTHIKKKKKSHVWLTIKQLQSHSPVYIFPPMFPIWRDRNLPVGPLAGQMNADTCHHCGFVLQTEGSQVQTARETTAQKTQRKHSITQQKTWETLS